MSEDKTTKEVKDNKEVKADEAKTAPKKRTTKRKVSFVGKDRSQRRGRGRKERTRSEFDQKVIDIRRVTRVMAGGRRFSFSVSMVAGDRNGRVGVGLGKGSDTAIAMEKATRSAKKNMIKVPLTKNKSIPKDVSAKYCSAEVMLKPARGKGLVAGSAVRIVLALAGITDVNSKILSRSKNKLNIARATVKALKKI